MVVPNRSTINPNPQLSWVAKHRPNSLQGVVGNDNVIGRLRIIAQNLVMPHILVSGPPGCGKITSVMALARHILKDQCDKALLDINTAREKGIASIQTKIEAFAKHTLSLPSGARRVVLLHTADSMTSKAQFELRNIIEKHSDTIRFALVCTHLSNITQPIQQLCTVVSLTRLSNGQMFTIIQKVLNLEGVKYDRDGISAVVTAADGDMRKALYTAQCTAMKFKAVTASNVREVRNTKNTIIVEGEEGKTELNITSPASARQPKTSQYTYRDISSLTSEAEDLLSGPKSRGSFFNVYGIVLDARAPSTCTGPDLRSEVILLDESSITATDPARVSKTLVVYRFDRDPGNGVPFCMRGDIMRCHRLKLTRYDRSGQMHVQGHAQGHSTFVLWAGEKDDEEPCASLSLSRAKASRESAQHTLSEGDYERVKVLRRFSRRFFANLAPSMKSFVRTVREVCHAPLGVPFLEQPFSLLGKFIPNVEESAENDGMLRFRIRDGRTGNDDITMQVESITSLEHTNKSRNFPFEAFARSMKLHKDGERELKWMLIHDVQVRRSERTAPRAAQLAVSRHTSTILWLPEYAPEVRALLSKQNETVGNENVDGMTAEQQPEEMEGVVETDAEAEEPPPVVSSSPAAVREVEDAVVQEELEESARVTSALETKLRTVGDHAGKHCPIVSVRKVVEAARRDERSLLRVRARVTAWQIPRDLRFATVRYCESCSEVVRNGKMCSICGSAVNYWAYRVKVTLTDGDGSFIHAWIQGDHATTFFGRKPSEMDRSTPKATESLKWLKSFADNLLKPEVRVDFLVQPYAVSKYGIGTPACRLVHTKVDFDEVPG